MPQLIVAIDGPAGSGKSSVARLVAGELRLPHLDTGGFYRAATLIALRAGIDPADGVAIVDALEGVEITSRDGLACVDGEIVEAAIRGPEVTAAVSQVSAHPEVRQMLVAKQRQWVADRGGSAVVEGRDIGTVVFPDTPVKVFLTADDEERARRRARERGEDPETHLEAIRRRDAIDGSREVSPMAVADDAIVIDTTNLMIGEVVETVVRLAAERGPQVEDD
ncbi:MAG: (d)CMP kinase [Acidimicrobiia bacterium]|nr:(d)CMP kinase [Acidimicrobiia bacterium]